MPNDRPRRPSTSRGAGAPRSGGAPRAGGAPRSSGGARSAGPRTGGARSGAPRDSERRTSFTKYGDRPSGPRTGGPRRDGDAPRGPRERSERKPYGERSERKPYGERSERKPYGDRPSGGRGAGPRREGTGPRRDGDAPRGRSGPRRDDRSREVREDIVERPLTAAEKKAREVRARTGGRRTTGHGEPTTAPKRERVEWVDEGAVRGTARRAVKRGAGGETAPARIQGIPRADRPLPGTVAREVERGVGARQSKSTAERLQKAIDAFERERYAEASKLLVALSRQLPGMALVHELAGLCAYRQSKWRTVINELETVRVLDVSRTSVLPVLADAYRAVRRWAKVNDLWQELKGLSPHPAVLAEGRIVVAGALADQGKMAEAIELFKSVLAVPKRVQEYHLREWYVVADLNDRVGNVADARRMFDRVAKYDRAFADVEDRLAQLGAPR